MRTSGHWVSTSGRTPLALTRKRSHTASFTLSAAKFRLVSGLCWAVTSTLMLWRGVNQASQATSLAARYRSCSLRYSEYDSSTNTRCASRLCRLSSITSRQAPFKATPPRRFCTACPPSPVMCCTSGSRYSSTPAAQGKNNWSWFKQTSSKWQATAPCATRPAQCADLHGIWRQCAGRSRCPAP